MPRRRTYHHGNLREALVHAATGLLEAHGPLGVSLRGAARAAGVSQTAPYRHFPNKAALLAAVAERGFRTLGQTMTRAADSHRAKPVEALQAMAVALVRFAAKHPTHYRLMYGPAVRGRDHPALRHAAVSAWDVLTAAIRECQRRGAIRAGDPAALGFVFWCLVHGLAMLLVDEQIPAQVLRAMPIESIAGHAARLLLAGLARP